MNKSELHAKLSSFPKNHQLSEESIENISKRINKEIEVKKRGTKNHFFLNRKAIAAGLLSMTLLFFLLWGLKVREPEMLQEHAGIQFNRDFKSVEEGVKLREEKDIYETVEAENSWAFDPREPENLVGDDGIVVKLKVLSIREAKILAKTETFYTETPYTPIDVSIQETINGKHLSGKKTIYVEGGDIRISNLVESWDKHRVSLLGLNKLTKKEQESKFMSFGSEYDYEMAPGKEYAVILTKQQTEGEIYTVVGRGYGIFEMEENKYRNVITGRYYPALVFSDNE
ncbi:hypothetical protein NQ095_08520 [Rossellomorea sp. SC111]|uniref:hypothetical protein n=1 Tax=Rossellomorea sp. SC111 TaxID=2968985 RepID=UPI00215A90FE|nr:hypothetical protein [Rossellomorea sp. SC111]MCR8848442.1 hypothetical protein [Rossellomorea sp. SC111]